VFLGKDTLKQGWRHTHPLAIEVTVELLLLGLTIFCCPDSAPRGACTFASPKTPTLEERSAPFVNPGLPPGWAAEGLEEDETPLAEEAGPADSRRGAPQDRGHIPAKTRKKRKINFQNW